MHNGISFTRLGAGLGHELSYKSEVFSLHAVLPLFYYHTLMQDGFRPSERLSEGKLYFEPRGWVSYKFASDFTLKLNGSIALTQPPSARSTQGISCRATAA